MDAAAFWRLIGKVDLTALREGDEEEAVEPVVDALANCSEADIFAFDDILSQFLHDIDGRAYADESGDSAKSADGFLYARCFVVAMGKKHYETVKADPTKMPKSLHDWCESLLGVAPQAWSIVTDNEEEDWDHQPPVSRETGSNAAKW
jgi:hypothetical protein